MTRLSCNTCGESIHPDTAATTGGLCMPCKGGYREQIEAAKRQRVADLRYERSPERQFWLSLVSRVHDTPDGVHRLSPAERTYYALNCLLGEVCNGGLSQFFFNSAGSTYGLALDGLFEVEAERTAALLVRAKELLFGTTPVPVDTSARRKWLSSVPTPQELEALDAEFWQNNESLDVKCKAYAATHALYPGA